jgi:CBS domain-containing protein
MNGSSNVGDIMTKDVIVVKENSSIGDVYELMTERNFRHMPVLNSEQEVVGIVSDRDFFRSWREELLYLREAWEQSELFLNSPISDIMSTHPETIDPEASVAEASTILLESKIGCLPVVDDGKLLGIVTTSDILRTEAYAV